MNNSKLRGCVICFLAAVVAGCGTVRPEGDYVRAGTMIRARTGSGSVYDPSGDSLVGEEVKRLLDGGLTADESVRVGLLNNKSFQSQFQEIGVSRSDVVQSGLLTNPTLMFSARFPEGGGRSNLTFGLVQDLVEIWQLPLRKRIARDRLDQTVMNVVRSGVDLASRVKTAYYQQLVLKENEKVAETHLALLEHSAQLAERRFNAGESTSLDLNLIRSDVLQGTIGLESARLEVEVNRAAFDHLLGLGMDEAHIELIDALPSAGEPIAADKPLVELALKTRLDVRAASTEIDAAAREIRRERRARLPGVSVGLEAERTDARAPRSLRPLATDFDLTNPSQALQDYALRQIEERRDRELEKRQNIDLLLGPSVELTLPVWDRNRAQIAKARYLLAQKQKDYEELLLDVVQEVRQAAAMVRASGELLRVSLHEAAPLAEKNVDTAQRMYEAGEETVLALLLAEQNLNAQRESAIKAAGDYAVAIAELEKAVGGSLQGVPDEGAAPQDSQGAAR